MDIKLKIFLAAAVVAMFAFLGESDYQEAKRQEAQYIEFVCAGLWGDYKDLKPTCE